MQGIRHLVRCRCILSQFKNLKDPPNHQFVVFSVIDDSDNVRVKFAQCDNCGIIHKVFEIGKSDVISNKETMGSITTIDDLKNSMPEKMVTLLEKNDVADVSSWEEAKFIIENEKWGNFIVLSKDSSESDTNVKLLRIVSKNIFIVENEVRTERI